MTSATTDRPTTEIYTLSLHDALPISGSWIISSHWAIQPGRRPIANSTVNISVGKIGRAHV